MKRTLIYLIPVAAAGLYFAGLHAQTSTSQPHAPLVVSTLTFKNQTGAVGPITLAAPNEGGYYRVSIYLNGIVPSSDPIEFIRPELQFFTDAGQPGFENFPDVISGMVGLSLNGFGFIKGSVFVHIPARTALTIQLKEGNGTSSGGGVYNAYILTEHL